MAGCLVCIAHDNSTDEAKKNIDLVFGIWYIADYINKYINDLISICVGRCYFFFPLYGCTQFVSTNLFTRVNVTDNMVFPQGLHADRCRFVQSAVQRLLDIANTSNKKNSQFNELLQV